MPAMTAILILPVESIAKYRLARMLVEFLHMLFYSKQYMFSVNEVVKEKHCRWFFVGDVYVCRLLPNCVFLTLDGALNILFTIDDSDLSFL